MSKTTVVKGKGKLKNKVPGLLKERFGSLDKVNVRQIAKEVGLSYVTTTNWVEDRITRRDDESLIAWCFYFGVSSTDDILEYIPPLPSARKAG